MYVIVLLSKLLKRLKSHQTRSAELLLSHKRNYFNYSCITLYLVLYSCLTSRTTLVTVTSYLILPLLQFYTLALQAGLLQLLLHYTCFSFILLPHKRNYFSHSCITLALVLYPCLTSSGSYNILCLWSVSYTHLDVYKRQIIHSRTNWIY